MRWWTSLEQLRRPVSDPFEVRVRNVNGLIFQPSWLCLGISVSVCELRMTYTHMSDFPLCSYNFGWPVRTVERLPPLDLSRVKNPVLVIGNTVRY